MSADRWRVCPVCERARRAEIREREEALQRHYGTINAEGYLAEVRSIERAKGESPRETLRENWEVGMLDDGTAYFIYGARCQVCLTEFKVDLERETPFSASGPTPWREAKQ